MNPLTHATVMQQHSMLLLALQHEYSEEHGWWLHYSDLLWEEM